MSLPALCSYRQIKYTMHIIILQFHRCGCKIGGTWRIGRTPDCFVSHAYVPGSNPADPA